ncbi:hypothetical protein AVEN_61991-1 [Araneus ventricosus]|uniref:Uncharacterized protein n=1 Tax=Araneus ventricosus TaxID=182803 RepID=A0A4Y2L045_ARAVE|nr:hypothetical protein AVEN_61991-1 [Araneus ventricosus]
MQRKTLLVHHQYFPYGEEKFYWHITARMQRKPLLVHHQYLSYGEEKFYWYINTREQRRTSTGTSPVLLIKKGVVVEFDEFGTRRLRIMWNGLKFRTCSRQLPYSDVRKTTPTIRRSRCCFTPKSSTSSSRLSKISDWKSYLKV